MFLKRLSDLSGTLAFRLTAWYALIFTVSSVLALSVFYYKISVITQDDTDRELAEEIKEFSTIMADGGVDQVKKYMKVEVESEDEDVFFRLLSENGRVLAMEGDPSWNPIEPAANIFNILQNSKKYILSTLVLPDFQYKVRTIYGLIGPAMILQVGISLEDNEQYLGILRKLLLLLIFPLFLMSTVIGWLLAKNALKGVEEVTLTAIDITKGAYDKRVRVKNRLYEINRLAETFNSMLNRIQSLIKGMKEITDNIAHDLRSPLARIRGIAEMTLVGKSSISDYEKMAANTIEECDDLIDMINTMLDITETESGVLQNNYEKINLVKLIQDACELFRPLAAEKNIHLTMNFPDILEYEGDKRQLQRLVTNILENSIKYTEPAGSVFVSLESDKQFIHIKFADTGIGISEAGISKIFDRFYRCDRSRSAAGIGLGLSLAMAIANSYGGDIHVKSVLNQGSEFQVMLPV